MNQITISKGLAVAVILLFIGLGTQPLLASEDKVYDLIEETIIDSGLPDLKVIKLNFYTENPSSNHYYIYCYVMNQGDEFAYGSFTVEFKVKKTFFWWFNLWTIYDKNL